MQCPLRYWASCPFFINQRKLTHIVAHEAAYKIGILHRDISPGNILIVGQEELDDSDDPRKLEIKGGMLIDWDLSTVVNGNGTARQYTRTVS
jgi:serine/threonine protein kinase